MPNKYLGIDVGYSSLKLSLVTRGKVRTGLTIPTPPDLLEAGRLGSTAELGELLQRVVRENNLGVKDAAVVFSGETTYLRTVTMRRMKADQLLYNIPYEFSDYITDDLKKYVFDYATLTTQKARPGAAGKKKEEPKEKTGEKRQLKDLFKKGGKKKEDEAGPEGGQPEEAAGEDAPKDASKGDSVELLAVAAPKALIDEFGQALSKSGLRFTMAAPVEFSYILLMRAARAAGKELPDECCFIDLGYKSIRMHIFQGDKHVVTRVLEPGLNAVVSAVAQAFRVDAPTAEQFLIANRENCQTQSYCEQSYGAIAVELMRSLNFYRFSNPDSQISDVWLCGGGSALRPLCMNIGQALGMRLHPAFELVPTDENVPALHMYVQSAGIALV